MTPPKKHPKVKPVFPQDTVVNQCIFGDEDPGLYLEFWRHVRAALEPQDEVETMLVDDIVQNNWDALRYRRLQQKLIASCQHEGLAALLDTLPIDDDQRQELVNGVAFGDEKVVARLTELLASAGHDWETVQARTLALRSDEIAKFNALIAAAEKRRDRSLRDLEERRSRKELEERRRQKPAGRPQTDE